MRNIDDRLVGQFDVGRRHQECHTALPVGVDDRQQLGGWHLENLAQTTQPLRAANAAAVRFLDRQRLKDPLAYFTLAIARQRLVDLVGVQRQGLRHLADALIVVEIERVAVPFQSPDVPGAHQSMLQTGELIGLLTEIVQEPLQQPRRDLPAGDLDRPFDDPFVLLAIEPRNQELASVDHLGEPFELSALADEVGTHRQHDVDRHFLLGRGFQQQADELVGCFLLPSGRPRGNEKSPRTGRRRAESWSLRRARPA